MKWMLMPLRRYAAFGGRSRRLEFWMFMLFQLLVSILFYIVIVALYWDTLVDMVSVYGSAGGGIDPGDDVPPEMFFGGFGAGMGVVGIIGWIWGLALLIPNLAVAVRRVHDVGRSGWWVFALFAVYMIMNIVAGVTLAGAVSSPVPILVLLLLLVVLVILSLILFIFCVLPGTPGPNRYGPDPKGPDIEETFA